MTASSTTHAITKQTPDSGYASLAYAQALPQMGQPLRLPTSEAWLLQQEIDATGYMDVRGAYPLFCCADWQNLQVDLAALDESIAAVSLVTDPFGQYDEALLQKCFPDRAFRFKTHYLVDLSEPPASFIAKHHLRNVAKAQGALEIFEAPDSNAYLDVWCGLYENLVKRHNLRGLQAFSYISFARQFEVPGLRVFVAKERDTVVGMLLCITQGDYSYYHLAAYSDRGYKLRASFGLFMHSFEVLAEDGIQKLNLGGAAGLLNAGSKENGLARFKRGWSNAVRDVWFCGRVLNRDAYEALCRQHDGPKNGFFPAYRAE